MISAKEVRELQNKSKKEKEDYLVTYIIEEIEKEMDKKIKNAINNKDIKAIEYDFNCNYSLQLRAKLKERLEKLGYEVAYVPTSDYVRYGGITISWLRELCHKGRDTSKSCYEFCYYSENGICTLN